MKKLMFLGGNRGIIPLIKVAHEHNLYCITCDYLPDNEAHKFSDEYVNLSVVDSEAVLKVAREKEIDGICSFACAPGATTAAYVAEKMGLSFQGPYESVKILQNKGLFRKFLIENGFNSPHAKSYNRLEDVLRDVDYFKWPVIVKPTDSAGSRGVTKVLAPEDLKMAVEFAISHSRDGGFIVEDFLTFRGYHSSTDCFTIDGELKFCTFSDHFFDTNAENPYIPTTIIWPTTMEQRHQEYLANEIQRLMTLLRMRSGIYNIESCVGEDGTPYIMEISPRGGGSKIAEIQKLATGVDLIEAEICQAIGEPIASFGEYTFDGVWCEYVIHNGGTQEGVFKGIEIEPNIMNKYVKMIEINVKEGDYVEPFKAPNKYIGDMFLRFDNREELDRVMADISSWLKIILE